MTRGTTPAVALVAAALALTACGGGDSSTSSTTTGATLPRGCSHAQAPAPRTVHLKRPKQEVARGEKISATVHTSCGTFEIDLDTQRSPKTTNSFAYMVDRGVYEDTSFQRIVPGFVIQGGDPTESGDGGAGYTIVEPPPATIAYTRGTVAMAKDQVEPPGTSRSQFFVVAAADAGLPPNYAVLGKVSSGEDVVQRIAELGDPASGDLGTPLEPVVIEKITLQR